MFGNAVGFEAREFEQGAWLDISKFPIVKRTPNAHNAIKSLYKISTNLWRRLLLTLQDCKRRRCPSRNAPIPLEKQRMARTEPCNHIYRRVKEEKG